jgi:hypothetical protein
MLGSVFCEHFFCEHVRECFDSSFEDALTCWETNIFIEKNTHRVCNLTGSPPNEAGQWVSVC